MDAFDEVMAYMELQYARKLRSQYADDTPCADQFSTAIKPERTEPSRWLCPPPGQPRLPRWTPAAKTDIRKTFRQVRRQLGVNV